jgi:Tol biopolymer transport system component/predicted Ser/Thr protein kinase
MLHPGDRIGPLRIERKLGAGGMGVVFLARDERLERFVAVKVLDGDARGRMLREARSASALKHPNIVTVHDVGEHEGRAYIVMEYVEGETLDAMVKRRGPLAPSEAVRLVVEAAGAIAAAHAAGVLHRDIKSANLMVDAQGKVVVLDFGLSKRTGAPAAPSEPPPPSLPSRPKLDVDASAETLAPALEDVASAETISGDPQTQAGARMGTPGWSPPELIDGRSADVRTDVFALGVVLYQLLTGELPFPATSWSAIREQMFAGAAPPSRRTPAVPAALDRVVLAALEADPAKRPDSVTAFASAAASAVASPPPRRRDGAIVAGGVAVLGAAVVVVFAWPHGDHAPAAPPASPVDAGAPAQPRAPTLLTHLGGCAYSPSFLDDDKLTFDLTKDGAVDLYELALSGGDPLRLTSDPGWEWRSSRGASANEVLYLAQTDTSVTSMRLDLTTHVATPLVSGAGGVTVFAGGDYYYAPNSATLRRISGGRDDVVLTIPGGDTIDSLTTSPDGTRIAMMLYGSTRGAARACWTPIDAPALHCSSHEVATGRVAWSADGASLYTQLGDQIQRLHLADDTITTVLQGEAFGGLAVSPSGKTMVFSDCDARTNLVSVLDDPSHPLVSDEHASQPRVGAHGELVYVRSMPVHRVELVERGADGTLRALVSVQDVRLDEPSPSPDGTAVAYVDAGPQPGIYLFSDVGQASNRLTDSAHDDGPQMLSDLVVFTRRDPNGVPHAMRIGRDGSNLAPIGNRPRQTVAADPAHHRMLLASPGGDYYYWWDEKTGAETPGPIASIDGQPVGFVDLSPDGTWMVYLGGANGQKIYRARVDGTSKPELVYQLAHDLSAATATIDDRGHPIVAIDTWTGELWIAPSRGASW